MKKLYILCKETYILYKTLQNSEVLHTGLCHWYPKVIVMKGCGAEAGNNRTGRINGSINK